MKNLSSLLLLMAIPSATALAQPKATTLQVVVEPDAKALLDGVTATYHAAHAVRFKVAMKEDNTQSNYSVSFQKPNLLRVEASAEGHTSKLISDGKASYSINGTTYRRSELPAQPAMLWQSVMHDGTAVLMPAMLEGRSPVAVLQEIFKDARVRNTLMTVKVPPPALVDGVALRGVKINLSSDASNKGTRSPMLEIYLWFEEGGLMRRISTRDASDKSKHLSTEQITDQQLDPAFAPGTFKFNPTGLKLAPEPTAAQEPQEFDPRLKVGAVPFAFSAKDLKGQTISPAKYKGKVLLLDFWATWCGPCVGALPELQGVYAKYHPKGLQVVGISLDEDKGALTSFIKARKVTWPQIFDGKGWNSRVPGVYGVQSIPFFLIVGKNGKIAAVNPRDDLEGAVKRALAAS